MIEFMKGTPFTKDTVNRMLKNEFYLGYTKYKGQLYPGRHEPLISQELFDKCQEVRARKRARTRALGQTKRTYIFSGLARCHVCKLTLRCMATQSKHNWRYYRHMAEERGYECRVPNQLIRSDKVEQQWSNIITKIRLPEDWQKKIEELAGDAEERTTIEKERTQVEERLRRLTQLYRDLLVEEVEYRENRTLLQKKLATLVLPKNHELIEAGQYLENLAPLWSAASLKEQQEITRIMIKAVYIDVLAGSIITIEPQSAFATLLKEVCEDVGVEIIGPNP